MQSVNEALQTIKHQADLVKLNLKAAGQKLDSSNRLPTTVVFRADKDATFSSVMTLINACQNHGFVKFALKAMTSSS